jgi:hypothetical protein
MWPAAELGRKLRDRIDRDDVGIPLPELALGSESVGLITGHPVHLDGEVVVDRFVDDFRNSLQLRV